MESVIKYNGITQRIGDNSFYFVGTHGVYTMINKHGKVTACDMIITHESIDDVNEIDQHQKPCRWEDFMKNYKEVQFKIDQVLTLI